MAVQLSSYTKLQARDRVKGDLGLRSSKLLTDDDIDFWMHDAEKTIAFQTHWLKTSSSQNVVAGTSVYDVPTTAIAIKEVWHDGERLIIAKTKRLERLHWNTDWRTVAGEPTHFYMEGMTNIGLYPQPTDNVTNGLVIHYTYFPTAPATDNDFYTVPTALDYALLTYAKMRASEKDATGEGRERLALYRSEWREFQGHLRELVKDVAEGELLVLGSDMDDVDEDDAVRDQLWNNPI